MIHTLDGMECDSTYYAYFDFISDSVIGSANTHCVGKKRNEVWLR